MLIASNRFHRIASCNSAFFQDGKVEATLTALQESLYDVRAAEPNTELKTRHAWLGDNELGRSNPKAVTNVNSFLEQPLRCEILAEHPPGQV
jgi:hypothetical protein